MTDRRTLLKLFSGLPLVGLTVACSETEDQTAACAPRPFHDDELCVLCGMTIVEYPGPKAQACVDDGTRNLGFCSTTDLFAWALQPENATRLRRAYVHDMEGQSWESPDDSLLMVAKQAHYVVGDPRIAAMGLTLVPFGDGQHAEAHKQHLVDNGVEDARILTYDEIDWDVLNELSSAVGAMDFERAREIMGDM